jgi:hypothetical protein
MVALPNKDINCVIVSRKDKAGLASENEIYQIGRLALNIYVLVFLKTHFSKKGSNISYEGNGFILEKSDFVINSFVNLHG